MQTHKELDELLTDEELQGKIGLIKYLKKHSDLYKEQGQKLHLVVLPSSITDEQIDWALNYITKTEV